VRAFAVENAAAWLHDYHFDGARLDATHAIVDNATPHVLQELVAHGRKAAGARKVYFFAEDDRNDVELVTRESGLDSLWADDFHHQIRVALAGDNESYFANFSGRAEDIAQTVRKGWFFCGQNAPDTGKPRGKDPLPAQKLSHFCYCIQNHDQVGNRAMGERLHHQIGPHLYRVASAFLLLVPEIPMIFQGQEFSATSPFQYFTDHNEELGKLVTKGRRKEFGKFRAFSDPKIQEKIPDPQAESTFQNSKLKWDEVHTKNHQPILKLYQTLLRIRRTDPNLESAARDSIYVEALDDAAILLVRSSLVIFFHLKDRESTYDLTKITQNGYKPTETVLTTDDEAFLIEGEHAHPPAVVNNQIRFSRAAAVVLRIKVL